MVSCSIEYCESVVAATGYTPTEMNVVSVYVIINGCIFWQSPLNTQRGIRKCKNMFYLRCDSGNFLGIILQSKSLGYFAKDIVIVYDGSNSKSVCITIDQSRNFERPKFRDEKIVSEMERLT